MKKILYLILPAVLTLAFGACGGSFTALPTAAPDAPTATAPGAPAATAAPAAVAPETARLLTTADVEKVGGLANLKLVARDPSKGAGGDLNFATQDNTLVLMVLIAGDSFYKPAKARTGNFHADVSGIGDEAFDGPDDAHNFMAKPGEKADPFMLVFRKGSSMVMLSSFFGPDQKAFFSQEKLRELGKIIASRM